MVIDFFFAIKLKLIINFFVHLSHAEVLCVRILRKYIYKQLRLLIESKLNPGDPNSAANIAENILEFNEMPQNFSLDNNIKIKPFKLKKNVNFHLFISSAPCGDGRIFSINENAALDHSDR